MNFVKRNEWGARRPRQTTRMTPSRPSTGHWNGPKITVSGKIEWTHDRCASLVRGIQNFHMDTKGWSDIAYNFVICPHGYVFEARGLNVRNGANGTNQGNATSHCVMWLAGENNPFTQTAKQGFVDCRDYICRNSNAPSGAMSHRDWHSTECPGDERARWIGKGTPVSGSAASPTPESISSLPILRSGSEGGHVLIVQTILRNKTGAKLIGDGKFGDKTEASVKNVQRLFKLTPDGVVGPDTWKALLYLNTH